MNYLESEEQTVSEVTMNKVYLPTDIRTLMQNLDIH